MIDRLIFDYGGTLDTNGLHWAHVLWEGYRCAGIPVTEQQFREAYVYGERSLAAHPIIQPTDNFHRLLLKKLHEELTYLLQQGILIQPSSVITSWEESVSDHCYQYVKDNMKLTRPVLEVVSQRYHPVMVTNFYGNMHSVLEDFGILSYFHAVIESAVCGVRKPDPAIFRLGVETAGCDASRVCVVGDSLSKDIQPAISIGCQTIWLKGRGWDDKEEQPTQQSQPTFTITSITQLPSSLGLTR